MDGRLGLLFVSLVFWTFAHGQRIYRPVNESEKEIEEACMKNLDHPKGTVVHLIEYEYDGIFDVDAISYYTFSNATNEDPINQVPCAMEADYEFTDGDRTILNILESGTCHDVLFYNDTDNPVVCLYLSGAPSTAKNCKFPWCLFTVIHAGNVGLIFLVHFLF